MRFLRRMLLLAVLPAALGIGISAEPADANDKIPWGCKLVNNTHCHCLSPSGLMDCMIID